MPPDATDRSTTALPSTYPATARPPAGSATAVPPGTATVPVRPDTTGRRHAGTRPARRTDAAVALVSVLGALYVTSGLWIAPGHRALTHSGSDQVFFEWLLAYIAHAVTHLTNPLFTPLLNAPTGVNIASNTAITVLGVLLTPVTLLCGPAVAFATALTLNLAGTACAWYWLFSRHVARTRSAAVLGGLFCGFAPGMIAQANGHLNFTAGWIVPILVWRLIMLTRGPVRLRDGVVIGVLAAVQYSLGAETLFFTGVAAAVYAAVWAAGRPRAALASAGASWRALAIAGLVAGGLLAYPMWMQFAGPVTYHGSGFARLGVWEDLAGFGAYPWGSLAGAAGLSVNLSFDFAEQNSYFGPVLLAAAAIAGVSRWRRSRGTRWSVEVRALGVLTVFIVLAAMGPRLHIAGWHSHIPWLWALLQRLPLFDSALPGRLALLLIPIIALMMVVTCDEVLRRPRRDRRRAVALVIAALALVPLLPRPLPSAHRADLPRFITSGDWQLYLTPGTSVLSVPPSSWDSGDAQRWQVATDFAFPIEGGYFLGVGIDGRSTIGPVLRPTSNLLTSVARAGGAVRVTPDDRIAARDDLAFWHTGLIVLPDPATGYDHPWAPYHDALLTTATELFGPPTRVDDVWLWRVAG